LKIKKDDFGLAAAADSIAFKEILFLMSQKMDLGINNNKNECIIIDTFLFDFFEAEPMGFIETPVPLSAQMLFRCAPQHNRCNRGYFNYCKARKLPFKLLLKIV